MRSSFAEPESAHPLTLRSYAGERKNLGDVAASQGETHGQPAAAALE